MTKTLPLIAWLIFHREQYSYSDPSLHLKQHPLCSCRRQNVTFVVYIGLNIQPISSNTGVLGLWSSKDSSAPISFGQNIEKLN